MTASGNSTKPRSIELLAPARDVATAIAAIDHGADAVYIGASAFGARAAAGNSTDDLRRLTDYAHQYRARVYATVNTIVYDSELADVERLIRELYRARVDALIVQDMGVLRLDIPPIELHASTQCDTRTPQKARFLQDVGFSQIVLARELTPAEIRSITEAVEVPVETFVHGALCVSYSGRCHAGELLSRRSANRGRCPQICRMKFDLIDSDGRVLCRDRHLLSLRDFNASSSLEELLDAGVSSFKIEGRLKDTAYVKNITAYYRRRLDDIIAAQPGRFRRSSCGTTVLGFTPDPAKSFNRGFTTYFLNSGHPSSKLANILTPKSMGEPLEPGQMPSNGDGLAFIDPSDGTFKGFRVNKVENGRIIPARPMKIPRNVRLYRTYDIQHEKLMARTDSGVRRLDVDIDLYSDRTEARDERGCRATVYMSAELQQAKKPFDFRRFFDKTGNTVYSLRNFTSHLPDGSYVPPAILTDLRRRLLQALDDANTATYPFSYRRHEKEDALYPSSTLDYRDNVANRLAEEFYRSHGVTEIEPAMELSHQRGETRDSGRVIMTCRYCILRQLGRCLQRDKGERPSLPLALRTGDGRLLPLRFDCRRCEMQVLAN